ncbi:hypothetical protein EOPP23_13375 [Endozoicomonas sp. OPT23]|uniref:hypothetical protein n=1 Tax=Endozoicomonas sp. OPT23 TaxID=2072845 RepID=UPI00129B9D25|nr:hypothetical protein [Endozoicomonas sp. OPT23]MRI33981.1 hypothetical protein [Endozoicomonas sp. OPT23]
MKDRKKLLVSFALIFSNFCWSDTYHCPPPETLTFNEDTMIWEAPLVKGMPTFWGKYREFRFESEKRDNIRFPSIYSEYTSKNFFSSEIVFKNNLAENSMTSMECTYLIGSNETISLTPERSIIKLPNERRMKQYFAEDNNMIRSEMGPAFEHVSEQEALRFLRKTESYLDAYAFRGAFVLPVSPAAASPDQLGWKESPWGVFADSGKKYTCTKSYRECIGYVNSVSIRVRLVPSDALKYGAEEDYKQLDDILHFESRDGGVLSTMQVGNYFLMGRSGPQLSRSKLVLNKTGVALSLEDCEQINKEAVIAWAKKRHYLDVEIDLDNNLESSVPKINSCYIYSE